MQRTLPRSFIRALDASSTSRASRVSCALALLIAAQAAFAGTVDLSSPTLRKIAENNTIVLGVRESSVPFSYLDANGRPIGYSQSIALKIVDEVRLRLQTPRLAVSTVVVTSANRLSYVVNHQIDLECGSTAHIRDREQLVSFSNSFFSYGIRMVVKRKSGIRNYADLAGKTVSTTAGTSDEQLLRELSLNRKLDLRIISAKDHAEAFDAVKTGRAVAFVMDDPLLYGKIAQEGPAQNEYIVTGDPLAHESYACMMRKGDPVFKKLADDVIAGMERSGEAEKLYDQWFMQPIPPDNINLRFPLSPEMRALFADPSDHSSDD
ncbi:Glutamate Aspartate periplasmic binding protein precursor GltI [Caballeronia sordidicola]|uniref:Glutamate Aspartate periplasmic binding protein GltI n=1 Tax=Caballeronia sordidicola TaxID=196367 RepID=A0A226X9R6_CABSO|nr:transporter substrate-binding domain-containing protein [Caballeronia sordidicola]OXC80174.1 Glutamate Aspartate periplasmic binding protein precursor GltI [Caballeronia sordidicola]